MNHTRIRLRPDCLEDRITPAFSPADVFGALQRTEVFQDTLGFISNDLTFLLDAGRQGGTKAIANVAAQQSAVDFAILADFFAAIQNQIAANPAQAGVLLPYLGQVGVAEYQAQVNQVNATFLSNALANVGIAPPPAPPPAPAVGQTGTPNAVGQTTNLGQATNDPFAGLSGTGVDQNAVLDALNQGTLSNTAGTTTPVGQ